MYPSNSTTTHIQEGLNLAFGRKRKDSDKDGVSDKRDECPDVFGLKEFRGSPDTDADGVQDSKDECPTAAATVKGCPDTDEDGIIDKKDKCPTIKGIEKFEGCPDSDEDGIQDSEDDCPQTLGTSEMNGCPDKDGDKIPYKKDNCPEVAGPKENKGCPKIEKEEEEVLKRAFDNLEFESGKDIIKSTSYSSLNELAGLMTKKKEWKLKISGHTDNVGNDNNNMKLSEKRATAVKNFLISKGIAGSRLSTLWYGETKPIAANETKEGRQKNRRVEMKIEF